MKKLRASSVFYIICLTLTLTLLLGGCMEDGLSAYELALKNGTTTAKSEADKGYKFAHSSKNTI